MNFLRELECKCKISLTESSITLLPVLRWLIIDEKTKNQAKMFELNLNMTLIANNLLHFLYHNYSAFDTAQVPEGERKEEGERERAFE